MPLGARALEFVRTLPDHRLLDRLIRGRAWIPLLGVMLAGIVAMQVEVLKLGASLGRSIERTTGLQSQNEALQATVATLDGDQRIESLAAQQGMVMPAPGAGGFLSARSRSNVGRAIANIHAPDAASFLALMPTNGAVATALNGSAAGATPASSYITPTGTTVAQAPSSQSQSSSAGASASQTTSPTQTSTTPATSAGSSATSAGSPTTTTGGSGSSPSGAGAGSTIAPAQTGTSQTGTSTTGGAAVPTG